MDNFKKNIKKYLFWIIAAVIVAVLVILPFSLEKSSENTTEKASILSGTAEKGSIYRTLSGAGSLASEDSVKVTVPEGVEVTGYIVSNGSVVSEGDPVATVNKVTVLKSALELSETIEKIETEMHHAEDDMVSGYIYSNGAGTVKNIYASVGDDVRQVMLEHGCLAVVELEDGKEQRITGISGTITAVNVEAGRSVYNGATMFTLTGMDSTGEYANLAVLHEKYQDIMAQLYQMYSDGYVAAPSAGMIGNVDKTLVKTAASFCSPRLTLLSSVVLLEDPSGTDDVPVTDYLSGTITTIDSAFQAKISGIPESCVVDLSSFSLNNPKMGDTVFLQRDTYTLADGTPYIVYTPLLVSPSGGKIPGGGDGPGGGGGMPSGAGGFGGGSGMPSGAGGTTEQEDKMFSLDGTAVATVTPTDKMTVSITIDELDILSIRKGDRALVTIDALPGRSFEGAVTAVNTKSSTESTGEGNSKYYAEITLDRTEEMLEGMNASGIITVGSTEDILTIPVEALCETGTVTVVYTGKDKNGNLTDPVEVETGVSDGEKVQILSGLNENDTFWYSYYDTLEINGKNPGSGSGLFSSFGRRPRNNRR